MKLNIGFIIFVMVNVGLAQDSSSTSTSSTTSTSTSTTSTTTTTTSTTTKKPLTPIPKFETQDGNLNIVIPHEKELYFNFEDENEEVAQVITFDSFRQDTQDYADDRLVDAKVYADGLNEEMTRVVTKLGEDAAMDVDVAAVQADLDTTKSNLQILSSHVDDVEQAAEDALDTFATDNSLALDDIRDDIADNKADIQKAANDATSARSALEDRVTSSINGATSSWTTKLTQAKSSLTSDLKDVEAALTAKINSDVGGVQGQVNTLKGTTDQHTNQITNLTPRMKSAEDKISSLQSSVNSLNTRVNDNKAKAEAAQGTANTAKTSAATANTNIDKLKNFFSKSQCGALTYTFVNSDHGTCEAQSNPIVTRYFGDSRAGTVNQWVSFGRKATYKKQGTFKDSVVLFHYQDSLGVHSDNTGSYHSCTWRLVVGNSEMAVLSSHVGSDTGWDIFPGRMTFPLELNDGTYTFEMQVHRRSYSSCLAGWAGNRQENHMMFEEIPRKRIGFVTTFGDRRLYSIGSWYDIPDRTLQYLKKDGDTDLHVFWTDVMGYNRYSRHTHSCHVRVLMSGPGFSNVHLGQNGAYSNAASGWKIRPRSLQYYIPKKNINLQPGVYTFRAQYIRDGSNGASECLQGWAQKLGNMVVVEKDSSRLAFAPSNLFSGLSKQSLSDYRIRSSTSGWVTMSGRGVTYVKQRSSSIIRVSYMDTIGWARRSHSTACTFRVLVNGVEKGRLIWSHSPNFSSTWNIDPYSMVWIITGIPTGSRSYIIQMERNSGANECLAGWRPLSGEPQNNFMLVEEIEQNKVSFM